MALTTCTECGHQLSRSARQCPGCGRKIRHTSLVTKLAAGFFGIILIAVLAQRCSSDRAHPAAPGATVQSSEGQARGETPRSQNEVEARTRKLKEEIIKARGEEARGEFKWRYDESDDDMGRGKVRQAEVPSLNVVDFGFPYQGSQRARLSVRIHPKFGKDVILGVRRGQFLCGFDGCRVTVRFDEGKAQAYSASGAADHSTTVLFLRGYDRFVAATKKAKRVYIEAQFYQEGTRVFEFDVSDFKW